MISHAVVFRSRVRRTSPSSLYTVRILSGRSSGRFTASQRLNGQSSGRFGSDMRAYRFARSSGRTHVCSFGQSCNRHGLA